MGTDSYQYGHQYTDVTYCSVPQKLYYLATLRLDVRLKKGVHVREHFRANCNQCSAIQIDASSQILSAFDLPLLAGNSCFLEKGGNRSLELSELCGGLVAVLCVP